jgi:hypothetical protein
MDTKSTTTNHAAPPGKDSPRSCAAYGSASDYNPAQCLRAEVERFKATNTFTPMEVTGFYLQAAVVLHEHRRMVEALKEIRDTNWNSAKCGKIAAHALPLSETRRTPNIRN